MRIPAVLAVLLSVLPAQVPDGWCVVSACWYALRATPGGLHLVHPRSGARMTVSGVGAELTGMPAGFVPVGASCVAFRSDDGALLVGEADQNGMSIELHEITLNGSAVATDVRTTVGTVNFLFGRINGIAMLPDGDAVFTVTGLANAPPLNGAVLARYSRATRAVTPIPVGPAITALTGIAVDRAGTTLYGAEAIGSSVTIHAIPLPNGGNSRPIATFTGSDVALAVDANGQILATEVTPGAIVSYDPVTGARTLRGLVPSLYSAPAAVGLEAATDQPVYVTGPSIAVGVGVFLLDRAGTSHNRASLGGQATGIAVADVPRRFGAPTAGAATYRWAVAPAPGGLPLAGNAGFAIRVDASGSPGVPGLLLLGTARADANVLGMRVLVEWSTAVPIGVIAPSIPVTVPIPAAIVPNLPVFLQSYHLDASAPGGIAASDGQRISAI